MALPYGSHHQRMMEKFIQAGYPPHVAAGFVGNAMMESGVNINPAALNKPEQAFGAFQMRGDRRAALEALARKKGSTVADLDVQIAHAIQELGSTEARAASRVQGAQSPEEAAALIDKYYERSAGLHTPQRQNYARHVYDQYTGGVPASPSPMPGGATISGQDVAAPVGGPGAAMGGRSPAVQSILDQIAAEAGGNDMMGMASQAAAPEGDTDLMAAQPQEDPGLSKTQRIGLGIGALGEALSAWSGKRPMDLDFIHEVPMAAQKRKQQVNEREAMIQLLNEEGFTDIATAGVNGLSLDDMRKAYEARLAANKPSSRMRQLQDAEKLIREGRIDEAELLLSDLQPDAPSVPAKIEIAQRLANPETPDAEKEWLRTMVQPGDQALIERLGTDPEFAEWYKTQQELKGTGIEVNVDTKAASAGAEALAKGQANRVIELQTAASKAASRNTTLDQMDALLNTEMQTGAVQGLLMPVKAILQDLGLPIDNLPEQQVLQSLQQSQLTKMMSDLKGAASDFESKTLLNTQPSVDKDEIANRAIIQIQRMQNDLEIEEAEFKARYFEDEIGDKPAFSMRGVDRAWESYKKDNNLTDVFKKYKTEEDAIEAAAAGEYDPNEIIIIGDFDSGKPGKLILGRHLLSVLQ